MNPDKFGLHEILRYFFSGSVMFLGMTWTLGKVPEMPGGATSGSGIALMSLLAFTAGAILYSGYRSILYVFLGRVAFGCALLVGKLPDWSKYLLPLTIPNAEQERDKKRWKERKGEKEGKPRLDEWASQIHLLYTSSIALFIGSLVAFRIGAVETPSDLKTLCFWGVGLAIISDIRRRTVEEEICKEKEIPN